MIHEKLYDLELLARVTADSDLTSDTDEVATLAQRLHTAKQITDHARAVQAQIEQKLADVLKGQRGPVEIPGVGTVERKAGTVRKQWDHTRLAPLVAVKALEAAQGEIDKPLAEWVAERIIEAAGINYWRVGVLKTLGLKAGDYCDESLGNPTVILRPVETNDGKEAA